MSLNGGTCSHDHDCSTNDCAAEWSLYNYVDISQVQALNEAVDGSAKNVIKSWDSRLDFSASLESNSDDPELIVVIPFTADVKIKSICVIGGTDGTSPSKMRAFINREDLDFSIAGSLTPVQEWDLAENTRGELEYTTKVAKFQGVSTLTLHFPTNHGAEYSRIYYIGLKGDATTVNRDVVANVVYETMARPEDHKVSGERLEFCPEIGEGIAGTPSI